jgi:hypothetical protein
MNKYFFLYFLFLNFSLLQGQQVKVINIDTENTDALNLSEIAEKVTPITLENDLQIFGVFLTNDYLFVASFSSVFQYDISGKFIREIKYGGHTGNITGDTTKKELYIPISKDNQIKSYDFSGKLKKTYILKNKSNNCFFYKNQLWIHSYDHPREKSKADHILSNLILETGEETLHSFILHQQFGENQTAWLMANGQFSIHDNAVNFSLATDSVLYKFQEREAKPVEQWHIKPFASTLKDRGFGKSGFIGKYLFINYSRGNKEYLYLEDTKNGKKYHVKIKFEDSIFTDGIKDDLFNTGYVNIDHTLNQEGYFYFTKKANETPMTKINI